MHSSRAVLVRALKVATCPKCGAPMARRLAPQSSHPAQPFWGCTRFPACYGMQPMQLPRLVRY